MKKELIFLNCILKSTDIFTITSQIPVIYFFSKYTDFPEQKRMRWIFVAQWGSRVPNFRTITYVTLQLKSDGEGKRESLYLF